MAGQLSASQDEINRFATGAGGVDETHKNLLTAIRTLKSYEESVTSTWSGQSRAAFEKFMDQYYFSADKMTNKLAETCESLLKTASNFASQDQDFESQIKSQMSSLDLPGI